MSEIKFTLPGLLVFAGLSMYIPTASALFEPGVGIGLQYSDNAGLTSDDEDDDMIVVGYVGANIDENSGPLNVSATSSLTYENYTDNTFSDQFYFNLGAEAGWEMLGNRLKWQARDYFSQRLIDSIDADTPDNLENVNIFTFGPIITLPISALHTLRINPEFSDFYYEDSDVGNQRYSLLLDWTYQAFSNMAVGLGGGVAKTDFENENQNPNFTGSNIHVIVSGQRARSTYNAHLGATHVDRDKFENQNGITGSLDWKLDLTGHSNARVFLGSDLTDSSNSSLNSAIDPGRGNVDNVQISGDVIRSSILRGEYQRTSARLKSSLRAEFRDLDYKESLQDRETQSVGLRFGYKVAPLITSGLYGKFNRTKRTDINRTDKLYVTGGNIDYALSRKVRSTLSLQYQNKDSTDDTQEYSEFSVFIGLVYGFGDADTTRARRRTK